jgi:hypothetical protein
MAGLLGAAPGLLVGDGVAFDVAPPAVTVTATVVPGAGPAGAVAVQVDCVGHWTGAVTPPNRTVMSPDGE